MGGFVCVVDTKKVGDEDDLEGITTSPSRPCLRETRPRCRQGVESEWCEPGRGHQKGNRIQSGPGVDICRSDRTSNGSSK